jgi:GT2 family glycosyltransferase
VTTPALSVVIPTYRRELLLRRCLTALIEQRQVSGRFEIVVVDDGRSTDTRKLVEWLGSAGAAESPELRYVPQRHGVRGPAAARNTGWRAARAPIIAFTDDDTIPAPDWLCEGLAAMADGAAAVAGHVTVPLPAVPTDWERNTAGLDGAEFVTANCFVRREVLSALGGFDERFTSAWREDSDLYFSLLEARQIVVRAPRAVVQHPARPAPAGASLRIQKNMLFDALLYKKHPWLYRQKISAAPPFRYYLTVLSLASGLASAAFGLPWLAAACLAVWLALTARFIARRLRGTSRAPRDVADMVITSAVIPLLAVYWRLAGAWRFRVAFL